MAKLPRQEQEGAKRHCEHACSDQHLPSRWPLAPVGCGRFCRRVAASHWHVLLLRSTIGFAASLKSRETGICSADPAREGPAEANHVVTRSPGVRGKAPLCGATPTLPIADFSHRTLTAGLSQAYVRITPRLIGTVVKQKSPRRCVGKRVLRGLKGPAAHLRLSDARCLLPIPVPDHGCARGESVASAPGRHETNSDLRSAQRAKHQACIASNLRTPVGSLLERIMRL